MDELLLEIEGRAFIGFDEDRLGYDPNQDSFILTRLRTFLSGLNLMVSLYIAIEINS